MARFKYAGRSRQGKKEGIINASTKRDAMLQLREQGIKVIEMVEVEQSFLTKDITIGSPVKLQDMVIYLRQFSVLLSAGISIVDATKILAEQTTSKALKKTLTEVEQDLREGNPLSASAEKHKKIFSKMFVNMIRAGEAGGNMDEALERLAVHYEKQHHTKQKIISALAYPLVVGFIAIAVVTFLLVYVVPIFVGMFADFGGQLPLITRSVLNISQFMQSYWWLLFVLAIIILLLYLVIRNNAETKYYLDMFILKIPVFGMILQKAELARMTRTLSSLFSSSVPILQALAIAESIVENRVIAGVINKSITALEEGKSLTEPMQKHWAFPPLVTQMIAIGEETGSLDTMLDRVADFYEKEVDISTDRLKALIEPLLIVVLAGLVGTIVTAILVPMFEIFNQIDKY
ncbi:type II secretion system F family protein [Niallia nealsonii]|uniref:Type II secretion system F family protein n=1 Tax=Niallia nealsonii TaxID=115979 RepID=A0A2N0YWQ1_9BACI|nr:type II secretion system F family protein [Niallia nealsonii]PKG21686.1 type II secretion system F family protein [Niallia nealsonii]